MKPDLSGESADAELAHLRKVRYVLQSECTGMCGIVPKDPARVFRRSTQPGPGRGDLPNREPESRLPGARQALGPRGGDGASSAGSR